MVGYLVCSRYDTVWHLMNVAVDAAQASPGDRHAPCSSGCSSRPTSRTSSTRSRCAPRTTGPSACTSASASAPPGAAAAYYHDNREDALIMWRTVEERTTA